MGKEFERGNSGGGKWEGYSLTLFKLFDWEASLLSWCTQDLHNFKSFEAVFIKMAYVTG